MSRSAQVWRVAGAAYGLAAATAACGALAWLFVLLALPVIPSRWQPGWLAQGLAAGPQADGPAWSAADAGVNALLLAVFFAQHSGMARERAKRAVTKLVSEPLERPTYVAASAVAVGMLCWQWRPLPGTLWDLPGPVPRLAFAGLFLLGCVITALGVLSMRGGDLLGLDHLFRETQAGSVPPAPLNRSGVYALVRHPMWLGAIFIVWATPTMTLGRAMLAAAITCYVPAAAWLSERDLISVYGRAYQRYQRQTPMLVPRLGWRRPGR